MSKRPDKGSSLVTFPHEYVLLDIETTGLSPQYNDIIEVSALRVRDNQVVDRLVSLVKPNSGPLSPFITELTGITDTMLETAPPIEQVLPSFLDFVKDTVLVGYNVHFDINFLYDSCIKHLGVPLVNDCVDVFRIAKRVLPDLGSHSQPAVAEHFSIDVAGTHRAEKDCLICQACFERLQELILESYDSLEDFSAKYFQRSTKTRKRKYLSPSDITTSRTDFNPDHPFYQRTFVFTGKLDSMTRTEAMQLVVDNGGKCKGSVTRACNFLVLGNLAYASNLTGEKSSKWRTAEENILKGQELEIIPEDVFLDMLENN